MEQNERCLLPLLRESLQLYDQIHHDKAQVVAVRDRILSRRRLKFVLPNLAELARVVLEKRSLMPALLHGSFFLRKRHFNG